MDHDENAWKLIESPDGTEQMYICSSDTAMMWVRESKHERIYRDGKEKIQANVSIGRYSFNDKVMGVSSYNMTMNTALAQGVLSLIIE
ncbi:hypothetical protein [Candidatus Sodalis sp. SoCistrobi]|uniref:hypothetical protein n=1 Tax=Candidatus Sodalis sp. SoCistrobi TaxID=1922216 RepID=UPI0011606716|nr:hypothetical protein [Candidatus Sodalis sp. SoCistrobi]